MHAVDIAAGGCALIVFLSFCMLRRLAVFSAACVAAVVLFTAASARTPDAGMPDIAAAAIGLIALWLGLLFVRLMLTRSVSLSVLMRSVDLEEASVDASFARRLDEAVHWRLAQRQGPRYELTDAGRLAASSADALRRLLRLPQ